MAESTPVNEDGNVGRVNSFSKILGSPSRTSSKSKSSSSGRSRLNLVKLFGRKSSSIDNELTASDLAEPVEEVVQAVKDTILETPIDHKNEAEPNSKSSTETNKKKHDLLEKTMHGVAKIKEDLKEKVNEGMKKAKEEVNNVLEDLKAVVDKDKSAEDHQHVKPLNEVQAPSIIDRVKEEVVEVVGTSSRSSDKKEETRKDEEGEETKEKREDDCASSLAQGLQNLCAPWSIKKQE